MNSSRNRSHNSAIAMNIPSSHYALLFDYYQFPKKSAKVKQALLKKLNVGSINYNLMTWNKILTEWEANIEKLFINDLESFVESQFSKPDVDLFFHKAEIKRKDLPTDDEYSVILDHLELTKMSKESPKLWATIALEFDKRDGKFWKESFNKWADLVRKKKYFMQSFSVLGKAMGPNSVLTKNEERLLEFPQYQLDESLTCNVEAEIVEEVLVCRVCLKTPENLVNIHKVSDNDDETLATKINKCSHIEEIFLTDGLPQHICLDCTKLVETAWLFMKLCEKSNRLLREQKPEYVQTIEIIEISRESEPADEQMDFDLEFEDQDSDEAIEYEIIHLQTQTKVTQKATRSTIIKSPTSTRKESPVKSLKKEPQKALVPKEQSKVKSPEKRFVCDVCEKSFKAKMALNIHLRVHSNFRPHVCPMCGKTFKTISAVNNHKLSHNKDVKEFACDDPGCVYRTNTVANLRIHKRTHTNEKNYKCEICSYMFRTSSNLSKHVRNIHNQQKLHKCDSCAKEFFGKESLRKHEVTHSKAKNYHCAICQTFYGWYNGLQKHYKAHHPELKPPTERSFIC